MGRYSILESGKNKSPITNIEVNKSLECRFLGSEGPNGIEYLGSIMKSMPIKMNLNMHRLIQVLREKGMKQFVNTIFHAFLYKQNVGVIRHKKCESNAIWPLFP